MKRLAAVLLLAVGCISSDKRFVADAAAFRLYHEDRYERVCVDVKGPPTCRELQEALNLLEHHDARGVPVGLIPVANRVQQLGKVPPEEKKEIRAVLEKVKRLP